MRALAQLISAVKSAEAYADSSLADLLDKALEEAGLDKYAIIKSVIPTSCATKKPLECSYYAGYAIVKYSDLQFGYIPIWSDITAVIEAMGTVYNAGVRTVAVDNITSPSVAEAFSGAVGGVVRFGSTYVQIGPLASPADVSNEIKRYLRTVPNAVATMIFVQP